MEFQDHDYTLTTYDKVTPSVFTYKMVSKEIQDLVKLRVSNNQLFSGKRNTSMLAWRAILNHMNLEHKMTHNQAAKKWENLKKRYKNLKYPPDGVNVSPELWPFFSLMDDAMEGRLEGSAPTLKVFRSDNSRLSPICIPKRRKVSMVINSHTATETGGPEIEVSLNGDEDGEDETVDEENQEIDRIMREVEHEKNVLDRDRQVMEGEKRLIEMERKVIEREHLVLQREKAVLDREIAALDRDRASLERERAAMEREKAVMERERAMVEKDRDAVNRYRLALRQEKARLDRKTSSERPEEVTEDSSKGEESHMERKERFLNLFEKLLESF